MMKLVHYGQKKRLLGSHTIWICAACETCTARCPNDIDVAGVIDTLRAMALEEGVKPAERNIPLFHACFLGNIQATGRISEPILMGSYKTFSGDLVSDIGLAVEMLKKGKIKLIPSVVKDRQWISRFILPRLGKMKVAEVQRADVAAMHHAQRATPYQANRTLEVLKKAFNLAEKWGLRPDGTNPCRHVEKFKERKRERLLTPDELSRLGQALDEIEKSGSEMAGMIALVRLLVMTGCRLGEIQNLRWQDVDLEAGCLRLPDSKTGAKVVPLGAPAVAMLEALPRHPFNDHVCPGLKAGAPLVGIHRAWYRIRERAGLPNLRLHDLRHGWASLAASQGLSLPIIGAILGHSQPGTTNRYAHFLQEPLKQAADLVAGKIAEALSRPATAPKVVALHREK